MTVGQTDTPEALAAYRTVLAENQMRATLDAKAEGMSILNYNLANKQYVDALNIGKLLGVDTSRLRPYGGESTNTVNVIGTDAMDALSRQAALAEQANVGQQGEASAPTNASRSKGNLLRKLALGTGLVLSGAAIPLIADKLLTRDVASTTPDVSHTDAVNVPWRGKVEVDVY